MVLGTTEKGFKSLTSALPVAPLPVSHRPTYLTALLDEVEQRFLAGEEQPLANQGRMQKGPIPPATLWMRQSYLHTPERTLTADEEGKTWGEDLVIPTFLLVQNLEREGKPLAQYGIALCRSHNVSEKATQYGAMYVLQRCGAEDIAAVQTFRTWFEGDKIQELQHTLTLLVEQALPFCHEHFGRDTQSFLKEEVARNQWYLGEKAGRHVSTGRAIRDYIRRFGRGQEDELFDMLIKPLQ